MKLVERGPTPSASTTATASYCAIEDRCSHDDGPLCEGDWEPDECIVVCPRHGARFDLESGRPLTLPAFQPVATFPVRVVGRRRHGRRSG